MGFWLSSADAQDGDIRAVWARIKRGYNAKRIPRKQKALLLREWKSGGRDASNANPARNSAAEGR